MHTPCTLPLDPPLRRMSASPLMKHFFTPGTQAFHVLVATTLAHGPLVGICVRTSRIGSLLTDLIPFYTFVSKKVFSVSYILAVNLIVLICLFHNFSSLFCVGSIGKTHHQYVFSK